MNIEENLAWLDKEYLSNFEAITIDSEIKLQKPFDWLFHSQNSFEVMLQQWSFDDVNPPLQLA